MDTKKLHDYLLNKNILVDADDLEKIAAVSVYWEILVDKSRNKKAYTTVDTKIVYLHHVVFGNVMIDHINGNGLDNRKNNLRQCTNQQNCMNQKPREGRKYKGINKLPSGRFRARVTIEGSHFSLGTFDTIEKAALAYNEAAIKYYGKFARLNEVPSGH